MRSARALAIVRAMLVGLTGALACTACSAGSPAAAMPKMLGLVGQPNLTSFLDVRFGDSLYRVQTRFPSGAMETAPYGADTYRINNIEVDSVRYEQVKYEFTTYSGMQLVMAWFTPDSSGKVLEKLVQAVGPPERAEQLEGQRSWRHTGAVAASARRARQSMTVRSNSSQGSFVAAFAPIQTFPPFLDPNDRVAQFAGILDTAASVAMLAVGTACAIRWWRLRRGDAILSMVAACLLAFALMGTYFASVMAPGARFLYPALWLGLFYLGWTDSNQSSRVGAAVAIICAVLIA